MSPVFKKLNLKDQAEIVVSGAPQSYEPELAALRGVAVHRTLTGSGPVSFSLAFVSRQEEVDAAAAAIAKRALGDWSAVRFRRVEHIKTLTRPPEVALSKEGQRKSSRPRRTRRA